ncbi:MAG: DUF697 domain-containing protein [Planctomycetota bacterium]
MLRTWWKIIRLVVIGIGLLLSFFAVIEIIRAYQTLQELHPAAGYGFLGILFCGTVLIVGYVAVTLASRPAVLIPPPISDANIATNRELRRYGRYLTKYINRLNNNAALSAEDKDKAREGMMELSHALEAGDNKDAFLTAIEKAEEHVTKPILEKLNEEANRQIRDCVRDVMIGVTVSPYKAADLIIVLYRNLVMVMRIVRIYNSRPRFRQQLQILGDTIKVVATVNYINVGKSLLEGLGSKLRAFKGWNEQEAMHNLRNRVSDFYADVRDIFWKDILPEITKLVGKVPKEVLEKIRFALDRTGNVIASFVKIPVRTVTAAGRTAKGFSKTGGKARNTGPGIFRGLKSVVKKSVSYPKHKTRAIRKLFRRGKD